MQHFDHAVITAGAVRSGKLGRLSIGSHVSIAGGFLGELRKRYRECYTGIELVMVEGGAVEMVHQVREGTLDIGFVIGPAGAPDRNSRQVWTESVFVA